MRTQGFAVDREEYERGIACIAAPVYCRQGDVVAAMTLSFLLSARVEELPDLTAHVTAAARDASIRLGWREPEAHRAGNDALHLLYED